MAIFDNVTDLADMLRIESETDYENSLPTLLDGEGIFLRAVTNNGDIDVTFAG